MFFAPRKPKTTVFTMFFASGNKNHGMYNVFWPGPSKNTGIYAVFSMLQEVLFPCQRHETTVNYSVLGLLLGFVEAGGGGGGVLRWTTIVWIIKYLGWPASPLLRKAKLKVAPLELPFVQNKNKSF